MEVSSFTNLTFFWFSITMHSFFVSWICMTVLFLAVSYSAARRIMFLGDFCVPFSWRTNIGSSVLVTYNSIGSTVCHDTLFIYSSLNPEDIWMEEAHAWVFVVKLGGMRGGVDFFLQSCTWLCCQLTYWRHTMLQPIHSSCGEVRTFLSHTSASTHSSPRYREASVWHLGHYHLSGR